MKAKIDELETNSTIKNIRDLYRDISDFKRCFQRRTNTVRDEDDDLVIGGGTYSRASSALAECQITTF